MGTFIYANTMVAIFTLIASQPILSVAANGLHLATGNVVDLGSFAAESNQTATFILSNDSKETIRIDDIIPCCAYLDPVVYEKNITPGTTVPLDVIIDANTLTGTFEKTIDLNFNDGSAESVTLTIKGTAQPAISTPVNYIHIGHIPLQTTWSTNLPVTVREGLPGKLIAVAESNIDIITDSETTSNLQISIPPQQNASYWQGIVRLRIENQPNLRSISIHLEGYCGSSLHLSPRRVSFSASSMQTTLALFRNQPEGTTPNRSPLQCNEPEITIEERSETNGKSSVILTLSESLMHRLKTEQRIPIQFSAEGYVSTGLVIEYSPR